MARMGVRFRMVARAGLALVATAAVLGPGGPARAAGAPGLYTATTVSGAAPYTVATATCPGNKQLHGGGAEIIGGAGNVTVVELIPSLVTNSITATGYENGVYGGAWAVQAYAICADATPNMEVVTNDSLFNTDTTKSATAVCPAGKKVYGGGWETTGDLGNAFVQELEPAAGLNSVTVSASTNGGWASFWEMRAYAICGDPTPGMSRIELLTVNNSATSKAAQKSCPAGTDVYSIAGETTGGGDVILERLVPTSALLGAARAEARENGAFTDDWALTLYAICV